MGTLVWLDGALVPEAEARVSTSDHGLVVGDGAFEALRVYDGVPFAVSRHLRRLARSLEGLRLPPVGEDVLRRAVHEVVAANGGGDWKLRVTVTGGRGALGSGRVEAPPTVVAALAPLDPVAPTVDVVVAPWPG